MDQMLLLNKLAISRWAIEYLNAAQSGGVNAGLGEKGDPRVLSRTERALYESSLEMLNRFVAGDFVFDADPVPQPPMFPTPDVVQRLLETQGKVYPQGPPRVEGGQGP